MLIIIYLFDFNMNSFLRSSLLLLLLIGMVLSRPAMQRIEINDHVWEVPNEPGWEEVIKDVELVQRFLVLCTKVSECREIIKEMRAVFYRHPVSRKYLEAYTDDDEDILGSVFKWG